MKLTKFFAFALAALAFVGCEGIGGESDVATSGAITLKADKTAVALGETVTFTVEQKSEDGTTHDVTSKATIYDKDLNEVASKTFTAEQSGSYSFFATLGAENSNYVNVTVMASLPEVPADPQPENYTFNYRALVIDQTGVNCGYCPNATDVLRSLESSEWHKHYNEVTCHAGGYASGDPGNSAAANALNSYQSSMITGYPCILVNFWGKPTSYAYDYVKNKLQEYVNVNGGKVGAGISMAVTGDSSTVYCAAQVKSGVAKEYKITAWLLESGIYSPNQAGATKEYHKIYNNALRNMSHEYSKTNVQGDSYTFEANQVMDLAFELPIVSTKWNVENMSVLVIVSAKDANSRWEVANSAVCKINETKEFEYAE
jgi:plastocyanin